jgi:hypothetical protein
MAVRAIFFHGFMNKSSLGIEGLLLLMAIHTQIPDGLGEAIRGIKAYSTVADLTDSCGHRGVYESGLGLRMTFL